MSQKFMIEIVEELKTVYIVTAENEEEAENLINDGIFDEKVKECFSGLTFEKITKIGVENE